MTVQWHRSHVCMQKGVWLPQSASSTVVGLKEYTPHIGVVILLRGQYLAPVKSPLAGKVYGTQLCARFHMKSFTIVIKHTHTHTHIQTRTTDWICRHNRLETFSSGGPLPRNELYELFIALAPFFTYDVSCKQFILLAADQPHSRAMCIGVLFSFRQTRNLSPNSVCFPCSCPSSCNAGLFIIFPFVHCEQLANALCSGAETNSKQAVFC